MLRVPVEAHGELVAVLEGVAEAGLHGAPDPEVEREPDDRRARLRRLGGGPVERPVVDDDDLELRVDVADLADDAADVPLLVVRGDDGDAAQPARRDPARPGLRRRFLCERAHRGQYAPRAATTAGIVFARIEMSSQIDQFSR